MQYFTYANCLYRVCGCALARWDGEHSRWAPSGDLDGWRVAHEGWLVELDESAARARFPAAVG